MSILAVVWMVSIRPLISKSSNPCTNSFDDCIECINYSWYHRHFHVPYFFSTLTRSYLSIHFLSVLPCSQRRQQNLLVGKLSFFIALVIWSRSIDPFVSQNNREVCVSHFQGWIVYTPFVRMIKFRLLAQFLVDHLFHPHVSSLIHFLH